MISPLRPGLVGAAGEHYVAMRLAMNGMDAAIPPGGNPITDVVAHANGRTCSVQVKTRRHARAGVIDMTGAKVALPDFVVIVLLGETPPGKPDFEPVAYVLPRHVMGEAWERFGYEHEKRSNLRLSGDAAEFLEPFREAWYLVTEHLAEEGDP